MADSARTDPFADVISLVAGPFAAVLRSFDQLRRGSEELMKGFENFNATMANLNATAERVNRLLNDFEEPIRAMLPQITRTIKMADELSTRLAVPVDQVVPGLTQLANTLNNPVLRRLPTDLGQFLETINEVGRRMSPLSQLAEQASSMFGFRMPGFGTQPPRSTPAPVASPPAPAPSPPAPAKRSAAKKATKKRAPAKKAAPRRR
jgi:ABC-type transporter Mla subunit MlaD